VLFGLLFIYLFICIAYFRSLGADDFENHQEFDKQDFEQQAREQGE
jgi:hypothetical protein